MKLNRNKQLSNHRFSPLRLVVGLVVPLAFNATMASHCAADVQPFLNDGTGATFSKTLDAPISSNLYGNVMVEGTQLTSYTTTNGQVSALSYSSYAEGQFDLSGGGVRNAWFAGTGDDSHEETAANNLDVTLSILNAGRTAGGTPFAAPTGATLDGVARFFFSEDGDNSGAVDGSMVGTLSGLSNDFFLVESTGAESATILPLNADGTQIGNFQLTLSAGDWGNIASITIGGNGIGATPVTIAGVAFDLSDFTGTGTLSGLWGLGITDGGGLDIAVVGVNEALVPLPVVPEPVLHVNRETGAISLENEGGIDLDLRGYKITSEVGALDQSNWKAIADNYDANGPNTADSGALVGTVDSDDNWTKLSNVLSDTDLSEFQFGGDAGTLGAGQTIVLSQGSGAWIPWFNETDLQMELSIADVDGTVISVPITYDGNSDAAILRSDFDHDGDIDAADWEVMRDNTLTSLDGLSEFQAYLKGDLNSDGKNNIFDFALFVADYEALNGANSFATMASSAVPEPSSFILFGIAFGAVLLLGNRQQQKRFTMIGNKNFLTNLGLVITGILLLGASATTSEAVSPYATDTNTVHLYHFNELSPLTSSSNLGTAGNSAIAIDNTGTDASIFGAAGFAGFGNSADIVAFDDGFGFDGNGDNIFQRNSDVEYVPVSSFTSTGEADGGAFTLELMVNLHSDLSSVTPFGRHRELIGMDKVGTGRAITFRITSTDTLRFSSITDFQNPIFYEVPIPTTGDHAYEKDAWFHVAYSYDGNGNSNFYWTRADSGVTIANNIGTVTEPHGDLTGDLTGPLFFGNEGRGAESSLGLDGLLDEVRISSIARNPNDFIFGEEGVGFTAQVNETTGEIRLTNTTSSAISFKSYELTSDSEAIDAFDISGVNWNSLSDQSGVNPLVNPVDDGLDSGETWDVAGGASDNSLSEQFLLGSTTLDAGQYLSLGNIYDLAADEDFTFTYYDVDAEQVFSGLIDTFTSTALLGDFNGDQTVDAADYTVWRDNLGSAEGNLLNGNGDGGTIGSSDYALWKSHFGESGGATTANGAAVPEPTSVVMLLLGMVALGSARQFCRKSC